MKSQQKCRVCGCTQNRACPGGCHWVEEDLCSACDAIKIKLSVVTHTSVDKFEVKEEPEILAEELPNLDTAIGFVHGYNHDRGVVDFNKNEPDTYPVDVEIYTIEKAGKVLGRFKVY